MSKSQAARQVKPDDVSNDAQSQAALNLLRRRPHWCGRV